MKKNILQNLFFISAVIGYFKIYPQEKCLTLSLDFNDHTIIESIGGNTVKPFGTNFVEDRFGNSNSAVYLHGHTSSYINLGSSEILKSTIGSISLWVNIHGDVVAGKGYHANPLLMMRKCEGEDFNIALGIGYNPVTKRFGVQQTNDSLQEAIIFSKSIVIPNNWYHIAVTYNDDLLTLYINGELQGQAKKGFRTIFWKGDSVLMGKTLGIKNERFSHAVVDDVKFFNCVISSRQIGDLYWEPDPNRKKIILKEIMRYTIFTLILIVTIFILIFLNRKKLKRQKEQYELNNRVKELEVKVIRNQMNPHFVSNSLTAIQQLMYSGQNEKAAEYLANFSFLMRRILDYSEKPLIRLADELEIIKLNVELEQLRFENKFEFILKVDDNIITEIIYIPSLITQPFIENAVWHGLLPLKSRPAVLHIHIHSNKGRVQITIEDNGVGRRVSSKISENSKGTKLVSEKMESLNRFNDTSEYSFEIMDLYDTNGFPAGTKIILNLSELDPYV